MPATLYSSAEFIEMHGGNPVWVPALNRKVMPDGASLEQMPWGGEQFSPPVNAHARLTIQIARQVELVQRARGEFTEIRQSAFLAGNGDAAIEMVRQAKAKHDAAYHELEDLQRQLRETPEEQARLKALADRREAERRWQDAHARVQAEVGDILLCNQEERNPPMMEES